MLSHPNRSLSSIGFILTAWWWLALPGCGDREQKFSITDTLYLPNQGEPRHTGNLMRMGVWTQFSVRFIDKIIEVNVEGEALRAYDSIRIAFDRTNIKMSIVYIGPYFSDYAPILTYVRQYDPFNPLY